MNPLQTATARAIERHRARFPNRATFRADLKTQRGQGGLLREARKMVFGSYGRGLSSYFDSKNVKAH